MSGLLVGSRSTGRRQFVAFALFALALFSLGCQRKAARRDGLPAKMGAALISGLTDVSSRSQYYPSYSVVKASSGDAEALANRKIIRNASLELLVGDVGQSVGKIGSIVTAAGG